MANDSQKNSDAIIVVGDKVDLVVETGHVYRAMIEDRIENGPFLLAVPSLKGIPMMVHQDDDIYLVFYRESGRYIAQMKVIGFEKRGAVRYMWLLQKTLAQKNQRREAYRLPVSFSVSIYKYNETAYPDFSDSMPVEDADSEARAVALETANSKDLSVTGIALITRTQYTLKEEYTIVMQLKSSSATARASKDAGKKAPLRLTAAVRRCIPWRVSGKFNTGMQFMNVPQSTSEEIAKFVLTEQQRQIKMRRLGL